MQINTLKLSGNLFLAPMAGYSNWPMRLLCKSMGASLVFTEMVSANSLVFSKGKARMRTERFLESRPEEKPLGVQIFGADPEVMARAAEMVEGQGADIVDINLGCSVRKVLRAGAGAALLKEPEKAAAIFRKVRKAVQVPLSVKMRSGWDEDSVNAPEMARIAEAEGVDAVTIHARTATQRFSHHADWSLIAEVVSAVSIPVIGNGDVKSGRDVERMFSETRCQAVMIGRAARGNPWIFREAVADGADSGRPSAKEKHEVISLHYRLLIEHLGEHLATVNMRKHLAFYTKGMTRATELRERINRVRIPEQVWRIISGLR
jgi:tRNA-dihydrouridine synthase B